MIQKETNLVVADNSGARSVRAFTLYGGSWKKSASIGDIIKCAVKDAIPNGKVKKVMSSDVSSLEQNTRLIDQMVLKSPSMTMLLLLLMMITHL